MPTQDHVDNGAIIVVHREPCYFCENPNCQLIFSQNEVYFFEGSTHCDHESSQLRDEERAIEDEKKSN